MAKKIKANGLSWQVDSAGTGNWHIGESPDPRSIQTAEKYGIDIRQQRARQLTVNDLEEYDLILAMDQSNYRDILKLANDRQKDKVKMILNFVSPGQNESVPDPYWDDNGFDQVYHMLDRATEAVLRSEV